jgi:hypothetical protein
MVNYFLSIGPIVSDGVEVATGGSVSPAVGAHSYASGSVVPCTATVSSIDWALDYWEEADAINLGRANPINITVTDHVLITPHFVRRSHSSGRHKQLKPKYNRRVKGHYRQR